MTTESTQSPNPAPQQTRCAETAPAADHRHFSTLRQESRPLRLSLSLGVLGMSRRILIWFVVSLSVVQHGLANDEAALSNARGALTRLKAECDVSGQTNASLWTSNVSATEKARREAIAQLKLLDSKIVALVQTELQHATNEYREMLTVALAALRDDAEVLAAAELMLASQNPAVRVCASLELRSLKDKRIITHFKKALSDPYQRKDGSCVLVGDGTIFPVRMIASDALVELGVPFDEVRKLRGVGRH